MLSREDILNADDLPVREVETPEWGEGASVFVRTLSAAEREAMTDFNKGDDGKEKGNFLGRFVAVVACDDKGLRLFEDGDAEALAEKGPDALIRIMEAAQEHNGMTESAAEAVEKNSEPSQD